MVGLVGQEGLDTRDEQRGKKLSLRAPWVGNHSFTRTQKKMSVVTEQSGREGERKRWQGVVFSPVSPWKHWREVDKMRQPEKNLRDPKE